MKRDIRISEIAHAHHTLSAYKGVAIQNIIK